jgi:predicted phage-related endonuclease
MVIRVYRDMVQGSDEWLAARCGLLTASEMAHMITPTFKVADNAKTRAHVYELAAQRIARNVEPSFMSDDMLRGLDDEQYAIRAYEELFGADVNQVGFVTNDSFGFTIGCSPDALVGNDVLIEIKSRRQKYQVETIATRQVPVDHIVQIQTALLVTGRRVCHYVSYSAGLPMVVLPVERDAGAQSAILTAATACEASVSDVIARYHAGLAATPHIATARRATEIVL